MTLRIGKEGELRLRVGDDEIRVRYRRPAMDEVIETMVKKMPRGGEDEDALRALHANLELGLACVTGVGEGDLEIDGAPSPGAGEERGGWKDALAERCPLIPIALGQYLSAVPSHVREGGLKK